MFMKQLTKISLAWELYEQRVPKSHIAQQLEVHRETVGLWIKGIKNNPLGKECRVKPAVSKIYKILK